MTGIGEVNRRKLSDHPVVVLIGVLASIVTIVAFFSAKNGDDTQGDTAQLPPETRIAQPPEATVARTSQPSVADMPDLRQGTWTLERSVDEQNTNWSGSVLKITDQQSDDEGLSISGYFDWHREGLLVGREFVVGRYRAASRQLFLEGTKVINYYGRGIVPASYSAVLSGDGRRLDDGRWGNVSGPQIGIPGRWHAFR